MGEAQDFHHCGYTKKFRNHWLMEASAYVCLISESPSFISPVSFPLKFPLDSHVHGQVASHCCSCRVKTRPPFSGYRKLVPELLYLTELEGQNNGGLTMGGKWRQGLYLKCGYTYTHTHKHKLKMQFLHIIWVSAQMSLPHPKGPPRTRNRS